jgi:hypothetical protein
MYYFINGTFLVKANDIDAVSDNLRLYRGVSPFKINVTGSYTSLIEFKSKVLKIGNSVEYWERKIDINGILDIPRN